MSNDTPQARGADEPSEPTDLNRASDDVTPSGHESAHAPAEDSVEGVPAEEEPLVTEEHPAAGEAPVEAGTPREAPVEDAPVAAPVAARRPVDQPAQSSVGDDTAAFDVVPDQHDEARPDERAEPVILPPEPSGETSEHRAAGYDGEQAAEQAPVAPGPVPYEETASAEQAGTTGLEGGIAAATVAAPTPMYVTAPTPPKRRGNRLMGILIDIVATVAFAVVFALVSLALIVASGQKGSMVTWEHFLQTAAFWLPVVVFFLAEALLITIVNRAGWWAHVLGSFFVGVVVYFAYMSGTLLSVDVLHVSASFAGQFLRTIAVSPTAIFAGVIAREASLWFGAWIAARGRRIRAANLEAQREYDRRIAAGPTTSPGA
ncbi:hypothetical protein GCM10027414_13040 [Humibacter ginsengiterrae]